MPAVNFDFLLLTAAKRNLQVAAAERDAEVARQEVFNAAWQVRVELRQALADLAVATRRAAQGRAQAAEQRALVTLLEQRFAAGAIAAPDVSTARLALLRVEATVSDADGQAMAARARVAAALGLPLSALEGVTLAAPPAASFTAATLAAGRAEALRARPDVMIALAKYQSSHAALQLELARRTPNFQLGPGYQWDQGGNKWTLALGFELPLFSHHDAAISAATARVAASAAEFNATQGQVIAAIDQAATAVQIAQAQLRRARDLQAEARQQATLARQRFEAGAADQLEVQTAQLELTTAATSVVEAEGALSMASGQLEDALRLPLPQIESLVSAQASTGRTP
jgi:outer membrane protein TolC